MLPIVAFALLLLHTPPVVGLFNNIVAPTHTSIVPVVGAGTGLIVIALVVRQPVGSVYVIIEVPAIVPETIPVAEPMVALPLLLLHVPPPVLVSVVAAPMHTSAAPDIGAGKGLTVTVAFAVDVQVPLVEETVYVAADGGYAYTALLILPVYAVIPPASRYRSENGDHVFVPSTV